MSDIGFDQIIAVVIAIIAVIYFLNWYGTKRMIEQGKRKHCPNCREIIDGEAKVCKFCGRDV